MPYEDFVDLKHLTEHTTINFQKNTKGETFTTGDASITRVEKADLDPFLYETSFRDKEFKQEWLPNGKRSRTSLSSFQDFELKEAYNNPIPIAKKKFDDLMFLLRINAIESCHN